MAIKNFIAVSLAALTVLACKSNTNENMSTLNLTNEWDKTFPKSELVNHSKVTFHNRYGIELAADMYVPRSIAGAQDDKSHALPAIAVSGPFGAVKEANLVWTLGDIGVGIMAWVNVIAIILLSPKAFSALKEYENR